VTNKEFSGYENLRNTNDIQHFTFSQLQ